MPIDFSKKRIVIDPDTQKILEMLKESLPKKELLEKFIGDGEEKIRKGNIFAYGALRGAEIVSKSPHGSHERYFPENKEWKHGSHAEDIYRAYEKYLNELLEKVDREYLPLTQKEKISNKFVLVREILRRLVAYILSDDVSSGKNEDGKALIAALRDFSIRIVESNILNQGVKLSAFSHALAGKMHEVWIQSFQDVASALSMLNTFDNALSGANSYLRARQSQIQLFLIAELNPEIKPELLTADLALSELEKAKESVLEKAKLQATKKGNKKDLDSKVIVLLPENIPERAQLIHCLSLLKREDDKRDHIDKLFSLLDDTKLLIDIINCMNETRSALGWLPIFAGIFNLRDISQALRDYDACCAEILNTEQFLESPLGVPLARILCKTQGNVSFDSCITRFSALSNPILCQIIKNHFKEVFVNLLNLDKDLARKKLLNKSYTFINSGNARKLNLIEEVELKDHKELKDNKNYELAASKQRKALTPADEQHNRLDREIKQPLEQISEVKGDPERQNLLRLPSSKEKEQQDVDKQKDVVKSEVIEPSQNSSEKLEDGLGLGQLNGVSHPTVNLNIKSEKPDDEKKNIPLSSREFKNLTDQELKTQINRANEIKESCGTIGAVAGSVSGGIVGASYAQPVAQGISSAIKIFRAGSEAVKVGGVLTAGELAAGGALGMVAGAAGGALAVGAIGWGVGKLITMASGIDDIKARQNELDIRFQQSEQEHEKKENELARKLQQSEKEKEELKQKLKELESREAKDAKEHSRKPESDSSEKPPVSSSNLSKGPNIYNESRQADHKPGPGGSAQVASQIMRK